MAATARREMDTGEEDIAAIAKQISDHAEAIYQTWKARGLGPAEILSCRPSPQLKISDSFRLKTMPDVNGPRVEGRRELSAMRGKPEQNGTRMPEPKQDVVIENNKPPDLVPQRPETPRRPAGLALRLEVAREEERLMRALRTGAVLAERPPDVVPPLSLVDYAKSRYQDRLENPKTRNERERRSSLGAQVTEARTKFEARARRSSSAETSAAPSRPFLSRGSVAERVMMFEKCPSEAQLETAAKRKAPATTTWRGPKDVINKAQNYPGGRPAKKPSSAPAHTTLQRSVKAQPTSTVIPRFHFPKGRPPPTHQADHALHKVQSAFGTFPNSQVSRENFKHIVKACDCPLYWKMPLFLATQPNLNAQVDGHKFIDFWRQMSTQCHDQASRFVYILTRGASTTLAPEDFVPMVQDVVDTHPGLSFLKEATEFHSRYVHTVIARTFYCVNRSWSGRISIPELRRSNLLQVIQLLEEEEDINQITAYFSYEHFYVIYCKFWELDRDHDLFIDRHDLARHNDHALSSRMIDRVLSGCVTRGNQNRLTSDGEPRMSYTEFVWFLLAEEDKTHPTAIEYWFRCMDLDGDGILSMYELEYFYEEQMHRMEAIGIETLPFVDCLCQMLDMVHPAEEGKITLSDLKKCKMTPIFFDTFFNLEKYLDHEQRDPFATQRDESEMSEWDRFAAEEYELLVAEEGGSDIQDQISYDETDDDCLSPNIDEAPSTEIAEDSSVEESTLSDSLQCKPAQNKTNAKGETNSEFVDLKSICNKQKPIDKWNPPALENGFAERKYSEKPAPPEKPVSLQMLNGGTKKYNPLGNNSFLYSHLSQINAKQKDPPSYQVATAQLMSRYTNGDNSPNSSERKPASLDALLKSHDERSLNQNGGHKISEKYEKAVAERWSPQSENVKSIRSSLLNKVHANGNPVKRSDYTGGNDDDEDYARDSDECSI